MSILMIVAIRFEANGVGNALSFFSTFSVIVFGIDVSFIVRLIVVAVLGIATIGGFIQAFFDAIGQLFRWIGDIGQSIKRALTRFTRIFRRRKKTKQ